MEKQNRLPFLDVLRGIALIAMAIYHFGWDLAFFGYVTSEDVNTGPWKVFARCIASSFLILVGVSLTLAHHRSFRWHGFWKRWFKIAGAALIITIATYYFTPDAFIFFGILHQIAFASLAGLLFLRIPPPYVFTLGLFFIVGAPKLSFDELNGMYMAWTGLQSEGVRSNDYVPVFPWFGAVLLGIGARDFIKHFNVLDGNIPQMIADTPVGKGLAWLGQKSLIVYLVHQPILIALIYVFSLVLPATATQTSVQDEFMKGCLSSTEDVAELAQAATYCTCVAEKIDNDGLWEGFIAEEQTAKLEEQIFDIYEQCQPTLLNTQ